jgi:hypothetical protein
MDRAHGVLGIRGIPLLQKCHLLIHITERLAIPPILTLLGCALQNLSANGFLNCHGMFGGVLKRRSCNHKVRFVFAHRAGRDNSGTHGTEGAGGVVKILRRGAPWRCLFLISPIRIANCYEACWLRLSWRRRSAQSSIAASPSGDETIPFLVVGTVSSPSPPQAIRAVARPHVTDRGR